MFATPDPVAVAEFTDQVRKCFPGGQHVADHVADGPWYVMAVREQDSPNWLLELALAASRVAELPTVERFSTDVEVRPVYLMSRFVHELAHYLAEENEFMPDYDLEMEPFLEEPSAAVDARALVALLAMHDEDDAHVARLSGLVDRLGADLVARRIRGAHEAGSLPGRDELIVLVEAWHAALTVGATS